MTNIRYYYDALGNRIGKEYDLGGKKLYTWYVRDAQGNVLSIYNAEDNDTNPDSLHVLVLQRAEQIPLWQ